MNCFELNVLKLSTFSLVVVISIILLNQPAKAGVVCKPSGWIGQSLHVLKNKARKRAKKDWRQKVKAANGFQWASWSLAANKWDHCHKKGTNWHCIASAVPCKQSPVIKWK